MRAADHVGQGDGGNHVYQDEQDTGDRGDGGARHTPTYRDLRHVASGQPSEYGVPMNLKDHIRAVPDFPKPGILFYDISTLLRHADAWQVAMGRMATLVRQHQPDVLAGIESRGFLLAAPLAMKLGCGFVMIRKRGKLPGAVIGLEYALEYGTDRIEVQADAVTPGQRVVLVDDLLATGGTMAASIALLRQVGAEVTAAAALIELSFLGGRRRIDVPFEALVSYDS